LRLDARRSYIFCGVFSSPLPCVRPLPPYPFWRRRHDFFPQALFSISAGGTSFFRPLFFFPPLKRPFLPIKIGTSLLSPPQSFLNFTLTPPPLLLTAPLPVRFFLSAKTKSLLPSPDSSPSFQPALCILWGESVVGLRPQTSS